MPIVAMPDGAQVQFPDDMPPDQIRALIAQKFPDAEKQAAADPTGYGDKSIGQVATEAVSNLGPSAVQFGKDVVQPILHPIDTAESLGHLGAGVLQKFGIMDGTESIKYADALGAHFADRYGSVSGFKKAVAQDPVGVLADISTVLTAGGSAAARAPGLVGKVGEIVKTAGDVTNPLNIAGGVAKQAGKVAAVAGDALTQSGYANIVKAAEAGGKGIGSAESNAYWSNLAKSVPMEDVVKEAQGALASLRTDAGSAYRSGMVDVSKDKTVLSFKDVDAAVANNIKVFKGIELSPSTKTVRDQISDRIFEWKKLDPAEYHTPEGFDALKQAVGDIKDAADFGTPQRAVADKIYNAIRQTIAKQAPVYDGVMKGYAEAQEELGKISKELSLGKNVNPGTALRKLQSVMRDGVNTSFGYRQQLMEKLVDAGAETLPYAVAGQQMGAVLPRGLAGRTLAAAVTAGAGGAGAAHVAGASIPLASSIGPWGLAAVPFMSPAVTGTTAYGLGLGSRVLGRPTLGLAAGQVGRQTRP